MKAAVISEFGQSPQYVDHADPVPDGSNEALVEVIAAGLHHITRGQAAGAHYSSRAALPLVPGLDGVGRSADGALRYFVQSPGRLGSFAERTVIRLDHSVRLPAGSDAVAIAAMMNPAMASWLALRCRVPFQAGQRVLVLGATGCAGSLAVQVARYLGASQVIAVGRDEVRLARLRALGATESVTLGDARLGALARNVDFVLDFVWGDPAVQTMKALLRWREPRLPLTWVALGSMAGEVAALPGVFLRSAKLQIVGSGYGSVPGDEIVAQLPALAETITRGAFLLDVKAIPLDDVQHAWERTTHRNQRIVITPSPTPSVVFYQEAK